MPWRRRGGGKKFDLGFLFDSPYGPGESRGRSGSRGGEVRSGRGGARGRGRGRSRRGRNKFSFAEALALTMEYLSQASSWDDDSDNDDIPGLDVPVATTQHGPNDVLLGEVRGQIVGIQYYTGTVNNGEMVSLVREPQNKYDRNAVKVENVWGDQVGHIKRQLAGALSYIVDNNYARMDAVVPFGKSNVYNIPVDISLWGPISNKTIVTQTLRSRGFGVKEERAPSMVKVASTSSGKGSKGATYNPRSALGQAVVLSEEQMKNEVDTLFDNLKSLDKMTEERPAKCIKSAMYPHQKQALHWMLAREADDKLPPFWEQTPGGFYRNSLTNFSSRKRPASVRGGILADEMGLGKTLSVIALILHDFVIQESIAKETPPFLPSVPELEGGGERVGQGGSKKTADRNTMKSLLLQSMDPVETPVVAEEVIVVPDTDEIPPVSQEEVITIDDDSQDIADVAGCSRSRDQPSGGSGEGCSGTSSSRPKRACSSDIRYVFSDESDEFHSPEKIAKTEPKAPQVPKVSKVKGQSSAGKLGKSRKCEVDPCPSQLPTKLPQDPGEAVNVHPSLSQQSASPLPAEHTTALPASSTGRQAEVKGHSWGAAPGKPQTTLIVCPLSVLSNWIDQLREHVVDEAEVSVCLYYGAERKRLKCSDLMQQHVVITTYNVMAAEFKAKKEKSNLHKVEWLRVVLDEAHTIRNPGTLQTKAAHALTARCMWALTGTPIQNSIKDLWSLVAFLGLEPFRTTYNWWQRIIARPIAHNNSVGIDRVRRLMDTLALRRLKSQKVDGRPLVDLPARNVVLQYVDFSEDEDQVYRTMERDGRLAVSKYFQQGTVLEHYGDILAILMRLRQLCCHPGLCAKAAAKLCQAASGDGEKTDEERAELVATLVSFLSQGADEECSICLESIEDPVITRCAHVYCQRCIGEVITNEREGARCPLCRRPISQASLVHVPKDSGNKETGEEAGEWHSSAKVDALMECLLKQRAADQQVKSIVVSQFTSFLDLIQKPLTEKGFCFARLDGSMNSKARASAIREFSSSDPASPTVFLLSLKAGGVGINLTAASRLYLLDPAWNPACEEQCFDRCHRLGQTKDVTVTKFIVRGSVEEAMLQLQETKRQLMKRVFDGKKQTAEERRANRVRDIRILMGLNKNAAE